MSKLLKDIQLKKNPQEFWSNTKPPAIRSVLAPCLRVLLVLLAPVALVALVLPRGHGALHRALVARRVEDAVLLPRRELAQHAARLFDVGIVAVLLLAALLQAELDAVVRLVPLPERSGSYLNNRVLDERLRAHELVVRRVVDHVQNTGLARADLRAPGVVARLEA